MKFQVSIEELQEAEENASHNTKQLLRGLIAVVERQDYLIQISGADTKLPKKSAKGPDGD